MNLFFPGFVNIDLTPFTVTSIKGPAPFNVWGGVSLFAGLMGKQEGGSASFNYPGFGPDNVQTNMPQRWAGLNTFYGGLGNDYESMLTVISGGNPTPANSDTIGVWATISSGKQWLRQFNFAAPGTDNSVWRVSIRRRPTGAIVYTGDFPINLQAT